MSRIGIFSVVMIAGVLAVPVAAAAQQTSGGAVSAAALLVPAPPEPLLPASIWSGERRIEIRHGHVDRVSPAGGSLVGACDLPVVRVSGHHLRGWVHNVEDRPDFERTRVMRVRLRPDQVIRADAGGERVRRVDFRFRQRSTLFHRDLESRQLFNVRNGNRPRIL